MTERIGQKLGNYQLTRLLGEGGFAEVYLGEHIHLGTQAAIKLLHTQLASDDVEKFRNEARTIARLLHPNIVRVLDFGVEGRTPFLVMDYAPKGTLRQIHPKGQQVSLATVVSYVKQIADALQCAHDEKLVHRDVKPENILVGRRGEVLLSDFGIALVAQSSRYQGTQDMTGTMGYMSPEQIQGKPRPASDQYSLGIVVYEWLTGEKPFHGSFIEIVAQQMAAPPPPMREQVHTIPEDVERVVMIALEKDSAKRFGTVMAFAKAFEQASLGKVTVAVNVPPPYKPQNIQETVASVVVDKKPVESIVSTYYGHSGSIYTVAWSPDGRYIASGGHDKKVHVWNSKKGTNLSYGVSHTADVLSVAWSPDGLYLVSGSSDKSVKVWNVQGSTINTYQGNAGWWVWVRAVAWSPKDNRIAVGSDDKVVRTWNAFSPGKNIQAYTGHVRAITTIAWSPDGAYIASGCDDHTVHIWNADNRRPLCVCYGHTSTVFGVAWSPDGKRIVSASYDATVRIWDTVSGHNVFTYNGHSGGVNAMSWSPDGKYIASASIDKTVQIWNAKNGHTVFTHTHTAPVRTVAWSSDGKYIASGGGDNIVQVWIAPS